jgi:hypothetical protein
VGAVTCDPLWTEQGEADGSIRHKVQIVNPALQTLLQMTGAGRGGATVPPLWCGQQGAHALWASRQRRGVAVCHHQPAVLGGRKDRAFGRQRCARGSLSRGQLRVRSRLTWSESPCCWETSTRLPPNSPRVWSRCAPGAVLGVCSAVTEGTTRGVAVRRSLQPSVGEILSRRTNLQAPRSGACASLAHWVSCRRQSQRMLLLLYAPQQPLRLAGCGVFSSLVAMVPCAVLSAPTPPYSAHSRASARRGGPPTSSPAALPSRCWRLSSSRPISSGSSSDWRRWPTASGRRWRRRLRCRGACLWLPVAC